MSGFESAIRNAISRAPDGRPQTRQRIYDAARASLERNLARSEVADADTRRAALERTIGSIEEEWRAIAMRRPEPSAAASGPPAPPTDASPPAAPPTSNPTDNGTDLPSAAHDEERTPTSSTVPRGGEGEPGTAGPHAPAHSRPTVGDTAPAPPSAPPSAPPPATHAPGNRPVPNEPGEVAGTVKGAGIDPALARQLAERDRGAAPTVSDHPAGGPRARVDAPAITAAPIGSVPPASPATDGAALDLSARDAGVSKATPDGASLAVPSVDVPNPEAPSVAAPVAGGAKPAGRGKARRSKGTPKRARTRDGGAGTRRREPRRGRGRWVARALSLLVLVAVGTLGWRWLETSGMLEAGNAERVVVSMPGETRPSDAPVAAGSWTALLTRELAGAVGADIANLALSDRRAETIARILIDVYDVPAENLIVEGFGEQYLKVKTEGAERANRRVTVRNIAPLLRG